MDAERQSERQIDDGPALDALEVIVPNLHRRFSGVTATTRAVAPRLARLLPAAWLGPDKPAGIARLGWRGLLRLRWRHPPRRPLRIWHARRNDEMIVGILLRALGWRLGLVFGSAAQRRHTAFTRALIARMDAVIATSAAAASFLQRPATVIHHGVDPEVYRPPADRAGAWTSTGLPGRYGIGCFGRVRHGKGTDVFVRAMCRLLPHYPEFTAVVIGQVTPDERAFAAALQAEVGAAGLSGRVRFLGELPPESVPPWYGCVSIYVFASRVEGFGLTLLEAMASGAALVASRAGAAEVVVADGETGFLVPPGDVDALVQALEPLMRDPDRAADMGARARARAVEAFSIDVEVARTLEVYEAVWDKSRAR